MDCRLSALFVDAHSLSLLSRFLDGWTPQLIVFDEGENGRELLSVAPAIQVPVETLAKAEASEPESTGTRPTPEDLAYILYTSGSTGTPKGIMHTHGSGAAFTRWALERLALRSDDIFSSHAPFHFDLSICDLYAALGAGATTHLISTTAAMLAPYLVRKVPEWGITVWYSVPSILVAMLSEGDLKHTGFGRIRILLFAGDVFPTPQLRRLRRALPRAHLYNLFGPTETNVCIYYEVPKEIPDDFTAPIPIGRACEHLEAFVVDDSREASEAVEGTLWVRGDNLMQGYWNDHERTAASLRPDPRGLSGLAYCTGDRVRVLASGDFQFLGRRDDMIKTRGYRVEPREIENILTTHPDVIEAVVLPLPDPLHGSRIVVSILSRPGHQLSLRDLRSFCSECLPFYMIPEQMEVRTAFPRTSTGKTDRQALGEYWIAKGRV